MVLMLVLFFLAVSPLVVLVEMEGTHHQKGHQQAHEHCLHRAIPVARHL